MVCGWCRLIRGVAAVCLSRCVVLPGAGGSRLWLSRVWVELAHPVRACSVFSKCDFTAVFVDPVWRCCVALYGYLSGIYLLCANVADPHWAGVCFYVS